MTESAPDIKQSIKSLATQLGFEACGFAHAGRINSEAERQYNQWLDEGKNGCMHWAENYQELRNDPRELLPQAKTVIVLALNYFPPRTMPPTAPQVAYYAYGADYHKVLKKKMKQLTKFITDSTGEQCRSCVDSAPVRERYWAQQAGVGFVGRNNTIILPGKGSFFFLGLILTTLEVVPDEPCRLSCGNCQACVNACPTGAVKPDDSVDARRCLSCLTIEHHDELPQWVGDVIGNHLVGCDECQLCCPHNRFAKPTTITEFHPSDALLSLTCEKVMSMTQQEFDDTFGNSAIKRATLQTLKRTCALIQKNRV